jgi:hypothetical protein
MYIGFFKPSLSKLNIGMTVVAASRKFLKKKGNNERGVGIYVYTSMFIYVYVSIMHIHMYMYTYM